jgi:prepilin-type N-terminal cleavage/methylation domain-containing protein
MRKAFTAIELAVVLVIILILAAMIIPALEEGQDEARKSRCLSRVRQIGIAIETYQVSHDSAWPSARLSVCPGRPDWQDPTASLAALYPTYASKSYLFQCPATEDVVLFAPGLRDFKNCANFFVGPDGRATREEDEGKGRPYPPSYFYEGGGPYRSGIPRDVHSGRVVYGDECVHGYWLSDDGRDTWVGSNNHPDDGGNFLFADKSVRWLPVVWEGEPWELGRGVPRVPNPRYLASRSRTRGQLSVVNADSDVFWEDWGGEHRAVDADLAGMIWVDGMWREF